MKPLFADSLEGSDNHLAFFELYKTTWQPESMMFHSITCHHLSYIKSIYSINSGYIETCKIDRRTKLPEISCPSVMVVH
jgi:hypothetical protein